MALQEAANARLSEESSRLSEDNAKISMELTVAQHNLECLQQEHKDVTGGHGGGQARGRDCLSPPTQMGIAF